MLVHAHAALKQHLRSAKHHDYGLMHVHYVVVHHPEVQKLWHYVISHDDYGLVHAPSLPCQHASVKKQCYNTKPLVLKTCQCPYASLTKPYSSPTANKAPLPPQNSFQYVTTDERG